MSVSPHAIEQRPSLIRGWVRPYGMVFPLGAIHNARLVLAFRRSGLSATLLRQSPYWGGGYDWGLDSARGQPQASYVVGDLAHVRHPYVAVRHRPGDEPVEHRGA